MSAPTDWSLPAKTNRQVGQEHEVRTFWTCRPFIVYIYRQTRQTDQWLQLQAEGTCEAATLIKDFETRLKTRVVALPAQGSLLAYI